MDKPHIIFITSDQHRGDCYGFRGRGVYTPHLDRLAASGLDFQNCITPSLVCQPARASILTGQLPFTNGVVDNGIDLDPEIGEAGFGGGLSKAGYRTGFFGKAHFSTKATFEPKRTPENQSAAYPPDWDGPYMGFDKVQLAVLGKFFRNREPARSPFGRHYLEWFFDTVAGEEGYEIYKQETRPGVGANQTWNSALPVAWHVSSWVADRSIEYLKANAADGPVCIWASFPDPHHPFDCPEPWSRLHDPATVDIAKHHEKDLDSRPWWHRESLEGDPKIDDPALKKYRKSGTRVLEQADAQLREMTANYYGMISLIDHNVGRILNAIDEAGIRDNCLIVFTSDHGDLLGDHGLYLKGPTPYEGLLNVGAIVSGPGIPPGEVISDPVSTLDFAATFCDLAGAGALKNAQSQSLRPYLESGKKAEGMRTAAYSEWNMDASRCGVEVEIRTVRTAQAKLTIETESGAGEMYDLSTDPLEMDNVFEDPKYASLRSDLEKKLNDRPGPVLDTFPDPIGMA